MEFWLVGGRADELGEERRSDKGSAWRIKAENIVTIRRMSERCGCMVIEI